MHICTDRLSDLSLVRWSDNLLWLYAHSNYLQYIHAIKLINREELSQHKDYLLLDYIHSFY